MSFMWNSNILSMRPYETCVPEWVKNESMFLNPGTVSHRFKSIQLNRIEAPAAKLRSPNDLDVKKCVLEAAKSTRSTSNRWDVFCGSLHCFFVFSMAVWSFALQAVWHPEGEGSLEFVDLGQRRFVKNRTWNGIHSISNCYWFFLVQSLCKFHTHVNIVNRGFTAFSIFKDI